MVSHMTGCLDLTGGKGRRKGQTHRHTYRHTYREAGVRWAVCTRMEPHQLHSNPEAHHVSD